MSSTAGQLESMYLSVPPGLPLVMSSTAGVALRPAAAAAGVPGRDVAAAGAVLRAEEAAEGAGALVPALLLPLLLLLQPTRPAAAAAKPSVAVPPTKRRRLTGRQDVRAMNLFSDSAAIPFSSRK